MIEVEKRALVDKSRYKDILKQFAKKGSFMSKVKRFTLVQVDNSDFTADSSSLTDIKVRTTKDNALFTVKHGNWHDSSGRKENEINFNVEEINELVEMLISLGFSYFVAIYVTREKYTMNDLVITIDQYHHMDDTLIEIEKTVSNESEEAEAEKEIKNLLELFTLTPMSSEDTIEFVEKINKIEETQVDFTNTTVPEWFNKWKDFILCNI